MKNNIKTAREKKGFTQQECADLFGVKIRAWQTYEQGVSEPKYELLCKIADTFSVTTDYLLGREPEQDALAPLGLETGEKSALEVYLKLPEDKRQVIIDTMIALGAAAKQSREVSAKEQKGEDRLISLNPEYDDIYAKEYKCVGKVIGKVE